MRISMCTNRIVGQSAHIVIFKEAAEVDVCAESWMQGQPAEPAVSVNQYQRNEIRDLIMIPLQLVCALLKLVLLVGGV